MSNRSVARASTADAPQIATNPAAQHATLHPLRHTHTSVPSVFDRLGGLPNAVHHQARPVDSVADGGRSNTPTRTPQQQSLPLPLPPYPNQLGRSRTASRAGHPLYVRIRAFSCDVVYVVGPQEGDVWDSSDFRSNLSNYTDIITRGQGLMNVQAEPGFTGTEVVCTHLIIQLAV